MNLQITVPYQTCPFNCPFCIAKNPETLGKFENLYETYPTMYWYALGEYLESISWVNEVVDEQYDDYQVRTNVTCVITGCTEPTLNKEWLEQMINYLSDSPYVKSIELQTSNQKYIMDNVINNSNCKLDVVAVSCYKISQVLSLNRMNDLHHITKPTIRPTIIVNEQLAIDFGSMFVTETGLQNYKQVTFKTLQPCKDETINAWIDANKVIDVPAIDYLIMFLQDLYGVSVFYDRNCMDTKGGSRYVIFREDGEIYQDWNELPIGKENI